MALGQINQRLKILKSSFRFSREGKHHEHEWQLVNFLGEIKITETLTILRFNMLNPFINHTKEFPEKIREHIIIHSQPTATLIIVVNKKWVVLTQQHRPIFGRWIKELPRGWYQNQVLEIVARKVPQLLGDEERGTKGIGKLSPNTFLPNGQPIQKILSAPEDTGLRSNLTSYFIISIEAKHKTKEAFEKALRENSPFAAFRYYVHTIEELDDWLFQKTTTGEKNKGLIDAISIAAWTIFYFIRNQTP